MRKPSSSGTPRPGAGPAHRGQALVLFALFLLVLLGASALAIDYANWLLTDRRLQNIADHAALAGASAFEQQFQDSDCSVDPGLTRCADARAQAWTSLSEDLSLGLDATAIECLAAEDTPLGGWTSLGAAGCGGANVEFHHTLWVATPPPDNVDYTGVGGRYSHNHGVVWARVNEPTASFLARVFGLGARDRIGWATAGPLPTDFALQVFCRNGIAPQNGACGGSGQTALVIDGQGGIRLLRGDIGSNESLKVTATNGGGVVTKTGNVFLVEGTCSQALWRCPNGPPSLGGISDGPPSYNGKNAFYMPPQPVPQYQAPVDGSTSHDANCSTADANHLCVPDRGPAGALPGSPGDWTCTTNPVEVTVALPLCGSPHDYNSALGPPVNGTVRCDAVQPDDDGYLTGANHHHMHPVDDVGASQFQGHTLGPKNIYRNIADFGTPTVPDSTPTDWVYTKDGASATYRVTLGHGQPPDLGPGTLGVPDPGTLYLRWIPFRTINNGSIDTGGVGTSNPVTISVELDEEQPDGTYRAVTPMGGFVNPDSVTLTSGATGPFSARVVQFDVSSVQDFGALSLKFSVTTTNSKGANAGNNRGAGVSWAELETTHLSPFQPPRIPPGYYHSIAIPDGGCAVLDPTAATFTPSTTGLKPYQRPGIYEFQWDSNQAALNIGSGAFLIGDGVTMVFDPFTGPNSGQVVNISPDGALVLNTMTVQGQQAPCSADIDSATYNPSSIDPSSPNNDLSLLPFASLCAAWAVDSSSMTGVHPGTMLWTADDPANPGTSVGYCPPSLSDPTQCDGVSRTRYGFTGLPEHYRGITFYFMTNGWPPPDIGTRFQMGGGSGAQPGIAFRGVLYAPYDDVRMSGSNGFDTVGQVLAWTAKFNGGDAYITLDYPYEAEPAPPYLLEPGIGQ